MKNKLRAIANCLMLLTMPIWIYFGIVCILVGDLILDKNEERKKRSRGQIKEVFIDGKAWFWE